MIYKKILFKDFLPYEYVINKEKISKKRDINMIKILLLLSLLLLPYTYEVVNSNDYSSQNEVFVEDKAKCKVDFDIVNITLHFLLVNFKSKQLDLKKHNIAVF